MDPDRKLNSPEILPESRLGRLTLFVVAVPMSGFLGWGLVINTVYAQPQTSAGMIAALIAIHAILIALFTTAALGVVWAIAKPNWLRGYLEAKSRIAMALTVLILLGFVTGAAIFLLLG